MRHPIYRVTSFGQTGPYVLRLQFDDQSSQIINFEPILEEELYGPLRDPAEFARVKIDPEVHTLVWRLEQISIRRYYMIGPSMRQHSEQQHKAGATR